MVTLLRANPACEMTISNFRRYTALPHRDCSFHSSVPPGKCRPITSNFIMKFSSIHYSSINCSIIPQYIVYGVSYWLLLHSLDKLQKTVHMRRSHLLVRKRPTCQFINAGPTCQFVSLGHTCQFISLGPICQFISLGPICQFISVGPTCHLSLGPSCQFIRVGPTCQFVSLGPTCQFVSLGPICQFISVGPTCQFVSFGPTCQFISVTRIFHLSVRTCRSHLSIH